MIKGGFQHCLKYKRLHLKSSESFSFSAELFGFSLLFSLLSLGVMNRIIRVKLSYNPSDTVRESLPWHLKCQDYDGIPFPGHSVFTAELREGTERK